MAKKWIDGTVPRFLLVGVINTLVGCGAMFLLYNLAHWSYWLSSAANYLLGGIVSFFLNKYFTFRKRGVVLGAGGALRRQCGGVLAAGLRPCKAPGAAAAGGAESVASGERGHAGGHVPVHGIELSGPAFFRLSEVTLHFPAKSGIIKQSGQFPG